MRCQKHKLALNGIRMSIRKKIYLLHTGWKNRADVDRENTKAVIFPFSTNIYGNAQPTATI